MSVWHLFFLLFAFFQLGLFVVSYMQCKNKNAYGLTRPLFFLGMYVWGDVFIFSLFWAAVSILCFLFSSVSLFFLIVSIFWVVRSFGETIYWFLQQFSMVKREPPENVEFYSLFQNDAVWFVQQIKNQCITVLALVASIYFATLFVSEVGSLSIFIL